MRYLKKVTLGMARILLSVFLSDSLTFCFVFNNKIFLFWMTKKKRSRFFLSIKILTKKCKNFHIWKRNVAFVKMLIFFVIQKENYFTIKTNKKVSESDENWLKFFGIRAEENAILRKKVSGKSTKKKNFRLFEAFFTEFSQFWYTFLKQNV